MKALHQQNGQSTSCELLPTVVAEAVEEVLINDLLRQVRPLHPLVRRQVPNEGIKKLSACLPTGLRFSISGVTFS